MNKLFQIWLNRGMTIALPGSVLNDIQLFSFTRSNISDIFDEQLKILYENVIWADGKYAPCQGCFECWTKNPATCSLIDSLHEACRKVGQADDMVIITENCYGGYSARIKNILDRSIGTSTPMSTYRAGEVHHTLRYGKKGMIKVIVYGDISDNEKSTWELMITGINTGDFPEMSYIYGFLEDLAVVLLLGSGIIIFDIWLAFCIKRKKTYGKHYTRIMFPSFLFIICADMFFIIISIVKGGILRGWLSKKKPS